MRITSLGQIFFFCFNVCCSQEVSFRSDRWIIDADTSDLMEHLGQESLFLKGGIAYLKGVDLLNGSLEFDLAMPWERGFMGAVWPLQDNQNYEEFYLRPH